MRPLTLILYWGGRIVYTEQGVSYDPPIPGTTVTIQGRKTFSELVDLVCSSAGFENRGGEINLHYRFPEIVNSTIMYFSLKLHDDFSVLTFFEIVDQLSTFLAEFFIEFESIDNPIAEPQNETQTSFVSLMNSFPDPYLPSSSNFPSNIGDEGLAGVDFSMNDADDVDYVYGEEEETGESSCPESSEEDDEEDDDELENMSDDSDDDVDDIDGAGPSQSSDMVLFDGDRFSNMGGMRFGTANNERVVSFLDDIGDDDNPDPTCDKVGEKIPVWSGDTNQIALGMRFRSKPELKLAITRWGIDRNREHRVCASKRNTWFVKCNSEDKCDWHLRACRKSTHKMWQITKWMPKHDCLGVGRSKGHMNLTSTMVAREIQHLIEDNPLLTVKTIQKQLNEDKNVEISYKKAWHARLKAIDTVYGSWEESFAKLPTFLLELKRANPGTIVRWKHEDGCRGNPKTFKFVFWAFHPAIEAFRSCRPVICVDGTHLKGSYSGKLLVAVTHDANDYVLPIAYAIVDAESSESWNWFMKQLRTYVAKDRAPLCVISDRDGGLKNAMNNLEEWKEPIATHRFCLRHVKSNFGKYHRSARQKNLVWLIGSAKQERKLLSYLEELKNENLAGWKYLEEIPKDKWCVAYDDGNSRWGILTTNVSESYNNVLRGVRHLPIASLINGTFHRTVKTFEKRCAEATSCSEILPPKILAKFKLSEEAAKGHRVVLFNRSRMVYKVTTKRKTLTGTGGHVHKVAYSDMSCSCGKWEMFRRPCSHALAVCRSRHDNPLDLFDAAYLVPTFRGQYSLGFSPLRDELNWDASKMILLPDTDRFKNRRRGKLGEKRIKNEMDRRLPGESRKATSKKK